MTTAQPPGSPSEGSSDKAKSSADGNTPIGIEHAKHLLALQGYTFDSEARVGMTVAQFYKGVVAIVATTVVAVGFFYTKVAQKDDLGSLATKGDVHETIAVLTTKFDSLEKSFDEQKGVLKELRSEVHGLDTQIQVLAATKKGYPR